MARTAIKSALAVALLLVVVQLAYWLGVRRYFVSLAEAVAPVAQLDFDRVDAFPPGRIGLDGVRFGVAGREDLVLHAERLRAHSDDVEWLARWLVGRDQRAPGRLVIRLEGISASVALIRQLRRQADALGLVVPFEGVGCGDATRMADDDYHQLGWSDWRLDAQVDLSHDRAARQLEVALRIDRQPAGVLRADLRFIDVPDRGLEFTAGLGGARLDRVVLDFDEQGELARRNAHCSADGVGGGDFIARHLERVHDWLRGHGVVPDEPVWAMYRQWVAGGGEIHLVAEPVDGIRLQEYGQFAPHDRLRLLGLSARIASGDPVPVEATAARLERSDFRMLPPLAHIDPREAFLPPGTGDLLPVDRTADGDFPLDAGMDGTGNDGIADGNEARVDASSPDTRVAEGAISESGLPATVVVVAATYETIGFPELAMNLGGRVRIDTVSGNQHRGVVLDATADAVELEIRRYGGGARLPIARDQITRIERIVPPSSGD